MPTSPPPHLRVPDAAHYLGLKIRSVADRQWRLERGLPSFKVGRAVVFSVKDLDHWLAKHRERPAKAA
jgi:hypothetical protein